MSLPNLAGVVDCDIDIVTELQTAGIDIVPRSKGPLLHSEVPFHVFGRFGPVTFVRAWRYWVATGVGMPLGAAEELYTDPVGAKDVRVVGHAACPPPKDWAESTKSLTGKFEPCVCSYHVDSQEGLNLLVEKIREVLLKKIDWNMENP